MKISSILLLSSFWAKQAVSQDTIPVHDQQVKYIFVDSTVGLSKEQLFTNAASWIAKSFVDANRVTKTSDKDLGKIIIKGKAQINSKAVASPMEVVEFVIDFTIREGRYRVIISEISGHPANLQILSEPIEKILERFKAENYPFDNKKQKKFMEEKKEKDSTALNEVNAYMLQLIDKIKRAMSVKDDF